EVTVMVAVSVSPLLSVTVSVTVPAPGIIVTLAVVLPETIRTAPLADHKYEAMVRPQEAALPLASSTAFTPAAMAGSTTAAMGRCAACTALYAFTMPLPHWPEGGQEHWFEPSAVSKFGHTGIFPVF